MKPQKPALFALIVISITLLGVLLLTNQKLCEVRIRSGETEVVASMAYESR
ncbi:MAG: Hok/Gef family protein [Hafnia sp.]